MVKIEIVDFAKNPMGFLSEAVHSAGYSGALANPLYAPESALDRLNGDLLEEFMIFQNLIEQCLQLYMSQEDYNSITLLEQAKIEHGFTGLVQEEEVRDFSAVGIMVTYSLIDEIKVCGLMFPKQIN